MSADGNRVRPQDLLRVTAHHSEGTVVLAVAGEVDLLSAPMLGTEVTAALADAPELLVVDLSEVSFLASIGITVLLEARREAGTGTRVRVVAPEDGVVHRTLRLTGLHEALAVASTRDDALTG
ncbi:STAS domain-containing protein [Amycolatopsis sp. A133]|uniref:STAS domain-containing protein n=1 Tax=Amycolatopsis sp. A133 TaxID=3064472 RepID=UPI0027EC71C3|nr:STAS domain-containing protein [Amycolatopsis sp. A133]MDQ7803564.1 STAS domain-containing protein [Amycolatopsis sp. A133]